MSNIFFSPSINIGVTVQTNPEGWMHIHRSAVVTTMSHMTQAGWTKTSSGKKFIGYTLYCCFIPHCF